MLRGGVGLSGSFAFFLIFCLLFRCVLWHVNDISIGTDRSPSVPLVREYSLTFRFLHLAPHRTKFEHFPGQQPACRGLHSSVPDFSGRMFATSTHEHNPTSKFIYLFIYLCGIRPCGIFLYTPFRISLYSTYDFIIFHHRLLRICVVRMPLATIVKMCKVQNLLVKLAT